MPRASFRDPPFPHYEGFKLRNGNFATRRSRQRPSADRPSAASLPRVALNAAFGPVDDHVFVVIPVHAISRCEAIEHEAPGHARCAGVEMQPAKLTASGFTAPSAPESRVQEEASS